MITTGPAAEPRAVMLFLGLLAVVPLIGAQFGYGNQVEQFTIVARLNDPGFAAGDAYIDSAAGFGPRFYYARALAWLVGLLPLALIVHLAGVLCNVALGWVSFAAARRLLGADPLGAGIAAVMAVTNGSISLGLAGDLRFDSFQPANVAIVFALAGLYLLLRARPWAAVAVFVPAGLMHPLIGTEVPALAYGAAALPLLASLRRTGEEPAEARRQLAALAASALVFALAMALAWAWPALAGAGDDAARLDDATFFAILAAFRTPHHLLGLGFPRRSWIVAGLFVLAALLAWRAHHRQHGTTAGATSLAAAAGAVIGLCLLSLWFVDVAHDRLWVTAQLFRMVLVVKWVGFLFLGWLFGARIGRDGWAAAALAALIAATTADAQGLVLIPGLLALAAIGWLGAREKTARDRSPRHAGIARWLVVIGFALFCAVAMRRLAIGEQGVRAVLGLLAAGLILAPRPAWPRAAPAAAAIVILAVGAALMVRPAGLFGWRALATELTWADHADDAAEIARAAARLAPAGSVWAVPPDFERFRLLSGHAVVVDFTSIPFAGPAMRDWRARIEALYGPVAGAGFAAQRQMAANWRDHGAAAARRAAAAYGATHAVLMRQTPWSGAVLAENNTYKAVALSGAAGIP